MKDKGFVVGLISVALVFLATFGLNYYMTMERADDIIVREDSTKKNVKIFTDDERNYNIYLITMDQGSNYWQFIDEGCRQAVEELGGIDYKWIGPTKHDNAEQSSCVDKAVNDGADAILISAISPTEINDSLARATAAGTKIIYVDSAATYEAVATLKTDNEVAGRIAGRTMLKALEEAGITSGSIGTVALNSSSTKTAMLRNKGFKDAFEDTNFKVEPVLTLYKNGNRQNIKADVKEHADFVGFFGSSDQLTRAISEQVRESGTRQIIIGFDTSDFTLSMIKQGIIYATMQQNPKKMGHEGIKIALEAIKGEFNDKNVLRDMGVNVITKENI